MHLLRGSELRPWGLVGVSIIVLLLAIGLVGVFGVIENERVKDAAERGLVFDVAIEDAGDDLRVAVLDLRHFHRNIVFSGPTPTSVAEFDTAYDVLLQEIEHLNQLGISQLNVPQPEELQALATHYYDGFRPSIVLFTSDPVVFNLASEAGLLRIAEMEQAAQAIDQLGERLTGQTLARVEEAAVRERIVLISLLGAAALIGVALSIAAGQVVNRLRAANALEQDATRRIAITLQTQSSFIADASHELRTPLTLIRGNAEIELSECDDPDKKRALAEILSEATRMGRLVDDLLFLARSDAGVPPIEREYLPVKWLLTRIKSSADAMARHHDACLDADLAGEGHVDVDPGRIEQTVLILIDNAAKFTPSDLCIELRSKIEKGTLTIVVTDHGPGIAAEELPRLFDRFYQVGSYRTRKRGGSGLGLAIAKSIVDTHGGTISIESELSFGTAVTIRLPLSIEQ